MLRADNEQCSYACARGLCFAMSLVDERNARARFWKLRLSTLAWGFACSYVFTGSLVTSLAMFSVIVAGNTFLMWRYSR